MKLNRTDTMYDREARIAENENWTTIENNFNNVVETVSDKAYGEVVDAAKLNWKEPVASFANLPTTANTGDTVMVRDTGKVYRYNGTEFKEIQEIDAGPVNEVDSRLTSQLAQKANKLEANIIDINYGEISLPSDFPHTLPLKLTALDENTVNHDFDINSYKNGAGVVYLDSSAPPSQDGLTPETAQKHLAYALDVAETLPQDTVIIYVINKYYERNYNAINGSRVLTKNIIFSPYNRDKTFIGSFESPSLLSWTSDGLAYKTTRSATHLVLDLSVKFKGDEPTAYKRVNSVAEVQAEQGTFYTSGSDVWIRRFDDKSPDDDIMVMLDISAPSFSINDKKLIFDRVSWFWYYDATPSDGLKVTGNANSELVLYKSSFAYAYLNGLAAINIGKVINVESKAYENRTDGFNYHGIGSELVYEYGIESFNNGKNGLNNNNASTAHDGMSIVRVNTLTYNCEGPVIADVNDCYSVLINCISHTSVRQAAQSKLKSAFYFSSSDSMNPGKAVLINCGGGGKETYALGSDGVIDLNVRTFKGRSLSPEAMNSVKFI